jgi:ribosomal-protein-alanine N-acetyltransferase
VGHCIKNDPILIGTISFWNVKYEHYRAEIGYAPHPLFQGRGLMKEAMSFDSLKLHSIEANVNPRQRTIHPTS